MHFLTKNKKLDSKGFTLIELLIVIIIIGILAAIAFIAFSGSQAKAHQSNAQSTVSEAQSKLGEYNADNGFYPKDLTTFQTWLNDTSSTGGDSPSLATSLSSNGAYTYTASPSGCDNSTTNCTGYTLAGDHTKFLGNTDISVSN